jgi:hypothetical protein
LGFLLISALNVVSTYWIFGPMNILTENIGDSPVTAFITKSRGIAIACLNVVPTIMLVLNPSSLGTESDFVITAAAMITSPHYNRRRSGLCVVYGTRSGEVRAVRFDDFSSVLQGSTVVWDRPLEYTCPTKRQNKHMKHPYYPISHVFTWSNSIYSLNSERQCVLQFYPNSGGVSDIYNTIAPPRSMKLHVNKDHPTETTYELKPFNHEGAGTPVVLHMCAAACANYSKIYVNKSDNIDLLSVAPSCEYGAVLYKDGTLDLFHKETEKMRESFYRKLEKYFSECIVYHMSCCNEGCYVILSTGKMIIFYFKSRERFSARSETTNIEFLVPENRDEPQPLKWRKIFRWLFIGRSDPNSNLHVFPIEVIYNCLRVY